MTFRPGVAIAAVVIAMMSMLSAADVPQPARAGGGATLAIDADISDGACVDIDAFGAAEEGSLSSSIDVAVCLDSPGAVPVKDFHYSVIYDDTIVTAQEIPDAIPSLDDNPDANAGATTFTSPTHPIDLGTGWDCSAGVGGPPRRQRRGLLRGLQFSCRTSDAGRRSAWRDHVRLRL
jgi:hypothetical protein